MHGLPADMDALCAIADRHGLAIVEDAAQAHGAAIRGRPVGGWGRLGAFSIQVTKNLPTCGEGGMVTTDDADLAGLVLRGRQFGEIIDSETPRDYVSQHLGWNGKISPIQAAFALSQLDRFDEYDKARQANIAPFLERLAALPGITAPITPGDRTHAYHLLRFRFSLDGAEPVALRKALSRLLRAEGVPVGQYQRMPLPAQRVIRESYPDADNHYPVTAQVIDDSLVIARHHLHPDSGPLLARYADAFEKIWANLDVVRAMTRGRTP
jgi:perosamine synthetase